MRFGLVCLLVFGVVAVPSLAEETFAEKLGWPEGSRVIFFHSDDLGMHHDANVGTIRSIEEGVVTSASTMMPCSWVPMWAEWMRENPDFDNGIHLTLTSEWRNYRWGPVAGAENVPTLVDPDGYLWRSVAEVVQHADPDHVEMEIRAQIAKARRMGLPITHLDSHMGTLFASPEFLARYVKVGIEEQIPVMMMGGHMEFLTSEQPERAALAPMLRVIAQQVWDAGLPVLDDLQTDPTGATRDIDDKRADIIKRLREMRPGVTMLIVHCTDPSPVFSQISGSGPNRFSDTEVMADPEIRKVIEEEGLILTTWRELHERRKALQD